MEDIRRLFKLGAMKGEKAEETIQALSAKKEINRENVLEYWSTAERYMDVEENVQRTGDRSFVFLMFTLGGDV